MNGQHHASAVFSFAKEPVLPVVHESRWARNQRQIQMRIVPFRAWYPVRFVKVKQYIYIYILFSMFYLVFLLFCCFSLRIQCKL